jgi:phenylalanyl-tRNA synthetase beta subunit
LHDDRGRVEKRMRVIDMIRPDGQVIRINTMSYGVRLTFRDSSKTLQDQQVEGAVNRMLEGAEKHCGAKLR